MRSCPLHITKGPSGNCDDFGFGGSSCCPSCQLSTCPNQMPHLSEIRSGVRIELFLYLIAHHFGHLKSTILSLASLATARPPSLGRDSTNAHLCPCMALKEMWQDHEPVEPENNFKVLAHQSWNHCPGPLHPYR